MASSSQVVSSSTVHRRGGSPLKIVDSKDGHVYYLINATGDKGVANVRFVQYYSSLNQYAPHGDINDPSGFFFVRDAASSGADHYGDPQVHAGWGMYIWDVSKYVDGVQNSGWTLVAKQGDVDWDITDELKAMFVLKSVYNARVNDVDNRFKVINTSLSVLNQAVTDLTGKMNVVYPLAHKHQIVDDWTDPDHPVETGVENLTVLNRLSDEYELLYYRGRPIGGNSYIYDHVEYKEETGRNEIVWCRPDRPKSEWTHEIVDNSAEIARLFTDTALARIGLSLFVVEANGDLSLYKYTREVVPKYETEYYRLFGFISENDTDNTRYVLVDDVYHGPYVLKEAVEKAKELIPGYSGPPLVDGLYQIVSADDPFYTGVSTYVGDDVILVPKFAQTVVKANLGVAEYVDLLPTADRDYVGRGCWVPLKNDGEHTVGHLHKCVETTPLGATTRTFEWVDLNSGSGTIQSIGSVFDIAYTQDATMWKKNYLYWTDPEDLVENGIPIKWSRTIVVRKIGSAPRHANDGEVVLISTTRNEYSEKPFIDVTQYSLNDPVYYGLFSESKASGFYASEYGKTIIEMKKPDWPMILDWIKNDQARKVFHTKQFDVDGNETAPADTIVLPYHHRYGYIECEIVDINHDASGRDRKGLLVVAKDVICKKFIDSIELKSSGDVDNPEYTQGLAEAGSNGEILRSESGVASHQLCTLNLFYWLNSSVSAADVWWHGTTMWDTMTEPISGGYGNEDGFLAGFEDTSMFATHSSDQFSNSIISSASWIPGGVRVLLPYYKNAATMNSPSTYFGRITRKKQLGTNREPVMWFTLNGVPTSGETRINRGFVTCGVDNTGATVTENISPEVARGVAPMFFIAPPEN